MMTIDREEYCESLRSLADLLSANENIPIPIAGNNKYSRIAIFCNTEHDFINTVRALGGTKEKSSAIGQLVVKTRVGSLYVVIYPPDGYCQKVYVGEEEVEEYDIPEDVKEQYKVVKKKPVYDIECPESILMGLEE